MIQRYFPPRWNFEASRKKKKTTTKVRVVA
jgi:hypothetical protein